MTSFLFWNTYRKELSSDIAAVTAEQGSDVVILAESSMADESVVEALQSTTRYRYQPLPQYRGNKEICVYCRNDVISASLIQETAHATCVILERAGHASVIIVAVHLPSQLHRDDPDHVEFAQQLRDTIEELEEAQGHDRTIVVGDLNMNPFHDGAVLANALHAVMDMGTASHERRKVGAKYYKFFYNPMWGLMGDQPTRPAGTYYYRSAVQRCYFWNTFDQVLLRPSIMNEFDHSGLSVLTRAGSRELLTKKGIPDKRISDHLPIVFRIHLPPKREL